MGVSSGAHPWPDFSTFCVAWWSDVGRILRISDFLIMGADSDLPARRAIHNIHVMLSNAMARLIDPIHDSSFSAFVVLVVVGFELGFRIF